MAALDLEALKAAAAPLAVTFDYWCERCNYHTRSSQLGLQTCPIPTSDGALCGGELDSPDVGWEMVEPYLLALIARIEQAEAQRDEWQLRCHNAWLDGDTAAGDKIVWWGRAMRAEAAWVRECENSDRMFDHFAGLCADRGHDHTEHPCTGCIEALALHARCVAAHPKAAT